MNLRVCCDVLYNYKTKVTKSILNFLVAKEKRERGPVHDSLIPDDESSGKKAFLGS